MTTFVGHSKTWVKSIFLFGAAMGRQSFFPRIYLYFNFNFVLSEEDFSHVNYLISIFFCMMKEGTSVRTPKCFLDLKSPQKNILHFISSFWCGLSVPLAGLGTAVPRSKNCIFFSVQKKKCGFLHAPYIRFFPPTHWWLKKTKTCECVCEILECVCFRFECGWSSTPRRELRPTSRWIGT